MKNIVIFGGPGSGKGTQSDRITAEYGLCHISTGEVLRHHIAKGDELGKTADGYISKGKLIPDELMIQVLERWMVEHADHIRKGVIFDGFPRTINQARALKEMLARHNSKVHAVLGLEVDEDELVRRMLQRGAETGRADDNIDTITKRLKVYHDQTMPLRDYYIGEGKYVAINGNGTIDEIFGQITESLNKAILDSEKD